MNFVSAEVSNIKQVAGPIASATFASTSSAVVRSPAAASNSINGAVYRSLGARLLRGFYGRAKDSQLQPLVHALCRQLMSPLVSAVPSIVGK